jgi:acyl-coenzyme A thioesterase PaaI-like protein
VRIASLGGTANRWPEISAARTGPRSPPPSRYPHEQSEPFRTASIRINFLRPFFAGAQSIYEGTALRIGRTSAIADSRAVGDDGKTSVIARVTGYR